MIAAQVLKHTGRDLAIDGDITWTFFPSLGLKVGHMVLGNPAEFKQKVFAEIDQATIGVKLLPLLHAKIESTGVSLRGLKLNLIKNASGATNWQMQPVTKLSADTANTAEVVTAGIDATKAAPLAKQDDLQDSKGKFDVSLEIPSVDITDSQVAWMDEQTKKSADISQFELHAKDIRFDRAFPLAVTFNFAAKNPSVTGSFSLNGKIKLDLDQQQYTVADLAVVIKTTQGDKNITADIRGNLAADMQKQIINLTGFSSHLTQLPGIKESVDIKSEMVVNLAQQTAKLTDFIATVANLKLSGNVNVSDLSSSPHAVGHLQAEPFDLKKFLQAIGQDSASIDVAKMLTADVDFTAEAPKTTLIQAISLQGKIKLDQIQAAKMKASNLVINAHLQNGILEFTPITAQLYQGTLESQAKINLTTTTPQISAQAKLANVQAEPLMQDLGSQGSKIKVKGTANIDLQITTAGTSSDVVVRNLNGNSHFSFKNGQVSGINIGNMIDSAYAFIKRQPAPAKGEEVTNFGDLTGTALIHNGVITNNDLVVTGPRFDTKGQGTIDLVNKQINYALKTTTKDVGKNHDDKDALNLYSYAIPISISGSLNNPSIRLDTQAIAQEVAKQQIKKVETQVQEKVRDQIKEKVAGQAGALLQNLLGH